MTGTLVWADQQIGGSSGEKPSFEDFYTTCHHNVYKFLLRKVKNPETAEDLTSETFVKAFEAYGDFEFRSLDETFAWIIRIARSQWSNYFRKNRSAMNEGEIDLTLLSSQENLEARVIQADQIKWMRSAILTLPERQREVLVLYAAGLNVRETAQALNVTENNVRKQRSIATAKIFGLFFREETRKKH